MMLSKTVANITLPPVPLAQQWAANYDCSRGPLLNLSQGVPGTPPPKELLDALGRAAQSSECAGYTKILGLSELRQALAEEMLATYGPGTNISPNDIGLTVGCNMAFACTMLALADPGDEAILPMPWYFNHQMTLQMQGIKVVPLPLLPEDAFIPSVAKCRPLISSRTKAIVLVSPNNPTGAIYPPALIRSFAELARENSIALVIDETYRDFVLDGIPHDLFKKVENWDWRDTVIQLFSFSKSYCVPGHRLGAVIASPDVLAQVTTVLDCLQICPPSPIQTALVQTLPSLRSFVRSNAQALQNRQELFRSVLPPTWKIGAAGGYFAFVRHPFKNVTSEEVCKRLVEDVGVLFLPATFFVGGFEGVDTGIYDRWIRVAVANVDDDTVKAVGDRLHAFSAPSEWVLDY
ncbi:hypothetical protein FRC02_009830 [Tulasnella sp. 418]|nr:hypothetical protein FRC02_009830 [Tulasnella sp. 418]